MPMTGFVVNRVHQSRPLPGAIDATARLAAYPPVKELGLQTGTLRIAAEALISAHFDFEVLAAADRRAVDALRAAAGTDHPVVAVPMFDEDVHDLSRLAEVGRYLFG
jgi:hypothetical protein